eukprot:361565-Chlamydomonas_euryale.AAC.2
MAHERPPAPGAAAAAAADAACAAAEAWRPPRRAAHSSRAYGAPRPRRRHRTHGSVPHPRRAREHAPWARSRPWRPSRSRYAAATTARPPACSPGVRRLRRRRRNRREWLAGVDAPGPPAPSPACRTKRRSARFCVRTEGRGNNLQGSSGAADKGRRSSELLVLCDGSPPLRESPSSGQKP